LLLEDATECMPPPGQSSNITMDSSSRYVHTRKLVLMDLEDALNSLWNIGFEINIFLLPAP
jgi:hypothetical protein